MSHVKARRRMGSYEAETYVAKVSGCAEEAAYPGAAARAGRHGPSNENLRFAIATHHRRAVITRRLEYFKATKVPRLNPREAA